MRRPPVAFLALGLTALLFGSTFVVVKEAIADLPPIAFVAWRFLIGGAALLLLAWPRGPRIWQDGFSAGFFLFAGYALQTWGLTETSASNSALITGLFVVATPLLAVLFSRRRPGPWTVVGAVVAFGGLSLLTFELPFRLVAGDVITLGCAFAFAAHIVVLSHVAYRHPVIPFTAVQLLFTSAAAMVASAIFEGLPVPAATDLPPLLITGLAVSAGAFVLQVWAQTVVGPARTAIVLSLEPVFGVTFAWWLLDERLTGRGWVGAALIVGAIYLVLTTAKTTDEIPAAEAISPAH